ncbi:SusD/RagB family nutrient-binding outer membrane lipoprotein [Terrimonas pollutisoli]|uniref:SusD/RagB family nutrient-binding outer membrane lipoprotein n=1 Tax=Terrimonas pollutisoli TaxID=3034147 RepID=UPI0023EB2283|nr:SusD/RagB family nutrient-binding outer membrane lipoprotein [Terrimonas sp. H1YJ31]
MKRLNKTLFFTLAGIIFLAACKKELDINTDPNNPSLSQGTPKLVFPVAVASTAGRLGGDLAILGGIWSQYWTQNTTSNQYKEIDAFGLTKTDFNGAWNELFSGALSDLSFVRTKAKESEDWTFYLLGTVINVYTFQMLVDLYDQVPYTEAFQGSDNLQPKFDDGDTVYKALIAALDDALSKDFSLSTNTSPGRYDLLFPGVGNDDVEAEIDWLNNNNLDKWIQFANTLKLKLYLRMVYAKPTEAEAGIKGMIDNGAEFLSENAWLNVFENLADKSNPLYEYNFRKLNTDANLKASFTFLSWLQANSDPRIPFYYQPRTGTTNQYQAIHQGDYLNPDPAFNTASKALVLAIDPVDFISLAESYFLQAEALERYYGGAGAKAMYDAGVSASFTRYGLSAASFLVPGGNYEYPAGDFEQKLEAIITQKWASMPNSHSLEAFFEKNRTGYPKYSPVYSTDAAYIPGQFVYPFNGVTPGKQFAKRLVFPDSERSKNSNTPPEEPITKKIWWDVK